MKVSLCPLCYRPVLRGVNLSNGQMIHEPCLLSAQKKSLDLSSKAGVLEVIQSIDDWDEYFEAIRQQLNEEYNALASEEQLALLE